MEADAPLPASGDMQTMIEMEREFYAEQDEAFERNANNATQDDTISGMSYGGVLEVLAPAWNMIGSPACARATISTSSRIRASGSTTNKWYLVASPQGTGYHWGGIFCVNLDTQIEGIFEKC